MIESFEHNGFHVEIHFNVIYQKYFWVTGHGQQRFIGACEYFKTVEECKDDARQNLDLLSKEI